MGGLVRDTLELLLKYSRKINGDGQIIHDRSLVVEAYDCCEKAAQWLQRMDDDRDGFPTGYGLIEINGLNMEMIDCAVYTCQAYDSFASLSGLMGKNEASESYRRLAGWLREKINQEF